jgi:VWFA-related protein
LRVTMVTPHDSARAPTLLENGTPAPSLSTQNLGSQESVVLAIDRSDSMHGPALANALAASSTFLATKPAAYRVSIVTFASQPLQLTGFSTSTTDADAALRSIAIDSRSGTTMFDAILLAADALKAESSAGRAIILLTDGQETTSKETLRQAIAGARRAGVAVYTIAIKDATFIPYPLRALAAETGGRMFITRPDERFTAIYNTITAELQHTWQLTYYTSARPGTAIHLTATAPNGSATATVTIPGDSSAEATNGSALSVTEIAMIAAALIVLILAAPATLRTVRNHRYRRGWDGFD